MSVSYTVYIAPLPLERTLHMGRAVSVFFRATLECRHPGRAVGTLVPRMRDTPHAASLRGILCLPRGALHRPHKVPAVLQRFSPSSPLLGCNIAANVTSSMKTSLMTAAWPRSPGPSSVVPQGLRKLSFPSLILSQCASSVSSSSVDGALVRTRTFLISLFRTSSCHRKASTCAFLSVQKSLLSAFWFVAIVVGSRRVDDI